MKCARCGCETDTTIMSMFNTDIICMACKEKETKESSYKFAREKERRKVMNGNTNYSGAGEPSALNKAVEESLKLPISTQYALLKIVPNFSNGAFWGFDDKSEALSIVNDLKKDDKMRVFQLADENKVLVEADPNYLIENVAKAAPQLVKAEDINEMKEKMKEAFNDFDKFISKKKAEGFTGAIGIYCVNDTTSIRYKGITLPAFRVNFATALQIFAKHGVSIVFNGKKHSVDEVRKLGVNAYKLLGYSPTNTGLFLQITTA